MRVVLPTCLAPLKISGFREDEPFQSIRYFCNSLFIMCLNYILFDIIGKNNKYLFYIIGKLSIILLNIIGKPKKYI